ncbi:aminoacyl-tRNA hydrolase [Desulfomicrobium sp. ZS1]|jgi:PTH1 family peptidyl-tRNA hydrolase|uniref:aminoacyl-tRNA hydrolase n=1 Tax=Desulfomicrobium sp. ZS1 TaxID=2952228 RepID=UPI0020B1E40E|nr:aminoacyl-tRNA hydrolase [Desulfomicrobium sp. ZS1]UTF50986.1 aminoacyl-tRNA hydrolase [Desulfomicrobium sp. ZS1]
MTYEGLIVGLGNPGTKYARTRHNFGFMLADHLLEHWAGQPGTACTARSGRLNAQLWDVSEDYGARRWIVAKPLTFMNLSGQVVGELSRKNGIPADRILVAHDELDLSLGTVRLKFSGGLAGHNGLKSVAAHLGTRDFARIRLGIGRPEGSEAMADYVLRSFMPAEWELVAQALGIALDAVLHYCSEGLTAATSRLHSR